MNKHVTVLISTRYTESKQMCKVSNMASQILNLQTEVLLASNLQGNA